MSRRLPPETGNSRAVVMGTWEYEDRKLGPGLPAVRNSFDRFTDLLVGPLCGWPTASITTVANEPGPGRVPDLLMTQFAAATDVALFYYVGHGLLSDDEEVQLCLGLTGTVKENPHRVVPTSLPYSAVRRALLRSPARTKLVILDCCHSSIALPPRLGQTDTAADENVPEELLDETGVECTYVLVAASRKYAYYESKLTAELPQTFFTKYLADQVERGITGGPPDLTMEMLYRRLAVSLKAGGHPRPAARGDSGGDYPFCRNAALYDYVFDEVQERNPHQTPSRQVDAASAELITGPTFAKISNLIHQVGDAAEENPLDRVLTYIAGSDGRAAARAITDAQRSDLPREQVLAAAALLRGAHQKFQDRATTAIIGKRYLLDYFFPSLPRNRNKIEQTEARYKAGLAALTLATLFAALGDRQQQEEWRIRSRGDYLATYKTYVPIAESEVELFPGGQGKKVSSKEDWARYEIDCAAVLAAFEDAYRALAPHGLLPD